MQNYSVLMSVYHKERNGRIIRQHQIVDVLGVHAENILVRVEVKQIHGKMLLCRSSM